MYLGSQFYDSNTLDVLNFKQEWCPGWGCVSTPADANYWLGNSCSGLCPLPLYNTLIFALQSNSVSHQCYLLVVSFLSADVAIVLTKDKPFSLFGVFRLFWCFFCWKCVVVNGKSDTLRILLLMSHDLSNDVDIGKVFGWRWTSCSSMLLTELHMHKMMNIVSFRAQFFNCMVLQGGQVSRVLVPSTLSVANHHL